MTLEFPSSESPSAVVQPDGRGSTSHGIAAALYSTSPFLIHRGSGLFQTIAAVLLSEAPPAVSSRPTVAIPPVLSLLDTLSTDVLFSRIGYTPKIHSPFLQFHRSSPAQLRHVIPSIHNADGFWHFGTVSDLVFCLLRLVETVPPQ